MTVFLQGLSAKLVAKLLGLSQGDISGLVIVGSNPIGILVARLFQANGHRVALIDTNAEFCKQAAEYDIPAFVSNGLDAKSLAEAGLDSVGTFVALTINTAVYRDWETDRKSTRLNSSHLKLSRMPSSA